MLLSHEIAREIEDQLEYPGQIKVTVIRESRAIDVAANKLEHRRDRVDAPRTARPAQALLARAYPVAAMRRYHVTRSAAR